MADPSKLLKDLQESLDKTQQDLVSAEKRRGIASSEAQNMENRNRLAVEDLKREIDAKRQSALKDLEEEIHLKEQGTAKANKVKLEIEKELEDLSITQTNKLTELQTITDEVKVLMDESQRLDMSVSAAHQQLSDLGTEIIERRKITKEELDNLNQQINELSLRKQTMERDQEILDHTVEDTERKVIELDAQFKLRRESLGKQTLLAENQLKGLLNKIEQAMNKDKQIRESWAEGQMALDKRTQSVRQMESRLSGAEDRIKELDAYM